MGDRANVKIKQRSGTPDIWLYSHWGGEGFQRDAFDAITRAKPRVGDPSYFTRILILELAEKLSGVGTSMDDNEHRIMVVDSMTGDTWWEEE